MPEVSWDGKVCVATWKSPAGELRSLVSRAELMDAVSHTQSGAPVGVRSLGFAAPFVNYSSTQIARTPAVGSDLFLEKPLRGLGMLGGAAGFQHAADFLGCGSSGRFATGKHPVRPTPISRTPECRPS